MPRAAHEYGIGYDDPDGGDELHVDLTFTAVTPPHYLGESHLDQPGRYQGRSCSSGEEIAVDSYGFRDRSWGPRPQFGQGLTSSPAPRGGYSYATASARDAFHTITMDFGDGCVNIHGYLMRDGEWAKLGQGTPRGDRAEPRHRVPARSCTSTAPTSSAASCTPRVAASTTSRCTSTPTCSR